MAATLHGQAQAVLAGERHGRRDIPGVAGGHAVGAGRGRPGVGPTAGLGQPRRVADVPGVLQALEQGRAVLAGRRGTAGLERRLDRREAPLELCAEVLPLGRGRPARLAGTVAPEGRAAPLAGSLGMGGRDHRQASNELKQVAAVHDGLPHRRGRMPRLLAAKSLILFGIVTTGAPAGTTGMTKRTSGQLRTGTRASKRCR